MTATFHIPKNQLPLDEVMRSKILARYFQRQNVRSSLRKGQWQLETCWSGDAARYVDPALRSGLDNWSTPLKVEQIPLVVGDDRGFMLALNDCWSLLSWSLRVNELSASTAGANRINIVHVDSHTDLGSPRISYDGTGWINLLNDVKYEVNAPESVVEAISTGAIGIGSFIVPMLLRDQPIDLFHLAPKRHLRYAPGDYALSIALNQCDPLFPEAVRPSAVIENAGSKDRYVTSYATRELLDCIDSRQLTLLHIDLDYFNNRFDGNPAWKEVIERHDPPVEVVLSEIDRFFSIWSEVRLCADDISIGVSPGFFPAEFWLPAIDKIRNCVKQYSILR